MLMAADFVFVCEGMSCLCMYRMSKVYITG